MREETIIKAMEMHDSHINQLRAEFVAMRKVLDSAYVGNLTHAMMWDVLLGLLAEKGLLAKDQFDKALSALAEKTRAAMDAEAKKKAETQLLTSAPLQVLQ